MDDASFLFEPSRLNPGHRKPGISGFVRVRNGADFLKVAIESHLPFFDEIVIVYNQCTDRTPDIAAELATEHPGKIRVIHYEPRVHPPGSEDHSREPWDSPHSYVNYYNFALAQTTSRIVCKLDDDHLAIPRAFQNLTTDLRRWPYKDNAMVCFSGLNLVRDTDNRIGVLKSEPFSGNGDIGFWRVNEKTHFTGDHRFERFLHQSLERRYHSLAYWHLKYLKTGNGFANYELDRYPTSRYHKKQMRFLKNRRIVGAQRYVQEWQFLQTILRSLLALVPVAAGGKQRIRLERFSQLSNSLASCDMTDLRRWFPEVELAI